VQGMDIGRNNFFSQKEPAFFSAVTYPLRDPGKPADKRPGKRTMQQKYDIELLALKIRDKFEFLQAPFMAVPFIKDDNFIEVGVIF